MTPEPEAYDLRAWNERLRAEVERLRKERDDAYRTLEECGREVMSHAENAAARVDDIVVRLTVERKRLDDRASSAEDWLKRCKLRP